MSTKIRLTRMGARHMPHYRIVVSDSRRPRDSRFIDVVGHYNPLAKEDQIIIDEAKVRQWIDKGATPSQTVKKLLHRTGLLASWDEEVRAKYRGKREAELR
ncbi:30S ribosomal protein S16, partial [candidate division KSB1 bacterium]